MADKLRKFRKDSYVEKRFGKDINISTKEDAPLKKDMSAAETKSVEKAKPASGAAKPSSFAAAFRAARDAGQKTFEWAGKPGVTFTTQYASEKKAAPAPARRSPPAATTRTNTPAPAPKQVDKAATPVTLGSAFDQTKSKLSSMGAIPRYLDRSTKGSSAISSSGRNAYSAMSDYYKNKAKREAEAKAKTGKEVTAAVASGEKYRVPKGLAAKKGGSVKGYAKGGSTRSVDGIAKRGKTRAPMKRK